jgi:hypothetical protein
MPKRRPFKPGYYDWTREDFKMISWCINNSIACCVIPARKVESGGYDFCVEIVINGKSNFSPSFRKDEVLVKQLEYYKYYYDKYNKVSK